MSKAIAKALTKRIHGDRFWRRSRREGYLGTPESGEGGRCMYGEGTDACDGSGETAPYAGGGGFHCKLVLGRSGIFVVFAGEGGVSSKMIIANGGQR